MNRKDLQQKFNIIGKNDDISLYRKRGEFSRGFGYCGNVSLKNGKVYFNKKSFSDIDALDAALREWEKTLQWPVDTYNPLMRKEAIVEDRIIWYLTEKMGFTLGGWAEYVKNIGDNCRISFQIKSAFDKETVSITSQCGGYTFFQEVNNADDGVAAISSIVNTNVLTMAYDIVDALSSCSDKVIADVNMYVASNRNILGFEKIDFKSFMIDKLEKALEKLKG